VAREPRAVSDETLRELERRAASGDREAAADLYYTRARIEVKTHRRYEPYREQIIYPFPSVEVKAIIYEGDHGSHQVGVGLNGEDPRWTSWGWNVDKMSERDREWLRSVVERQFGDLVNGWARKHFLERHQKAVRAVLGL